MGQATEGAKPTGQDERPRRGGRASSYGKGRIHLMWLAIPTSIAVIALLCTAKVLVDLGSANLQPQASLKLTFLRLLWFWVLAPPAWFAFEYFCLYKTWGDEETFEAFKYGQEIASRAWIGIAGLMTILATMLKP